MPASWAYEYNFITIFPDHIDASGKLRFLWVFIYYNTEITGQPNYYSRTVKIYAQLPAGDIRKNTGNKLVLYRSVFIQQRRWLRCTYYYNNFLWIWFDGWSIAFWPFRPRVGDPVNIITSCARETVTLIKPTLQLFRRKWTFRRFSKFHSSRVFLGLYILFHFYPPSHLPTIYLSKREGF